MSDQNVTLQIGKEIVTPIVEAKIKGAIAEALGGTGAIVEMVVDQIINQKVNSDGKVSSYGSDNKFTWLDVTVTNKIKEAVKEELTNQISLSAQSIKAELIKQIQTKKGSSLVAQALLSGLQGTFNNSWMSKLELTLTPQKNN